jgi:hypothetical protein
MQTFLSDEAVRPSGCFCQECITDLEVPLKFKLQFLEEVTHAIFAALNDPNNPNIPNNLISL